MVDKDIQGLIEKLRPLVSHWIFAPLSNPRCAPEGDIAKVFSATGIEHITMGLSCADSAFEEAGQRAYGNDLVLVFGSFFLVAEFLKNENRYRNSEAIPAVSQK